MKQFLKLPSKQNYKDFLSGFMLEKIKTESGISGGMTVF